MHMLHVLQYAYLSPISQSARVPQLKGLQRCFGVDWPTEFPDLVIVCLFLMAFARRHSHTYRSRSMVVAFITRPGCACRLLAVVLLVGWLPSSACKRNKFAQQERNTTLNVVVGVLSAPGHFAARVAIR